MKRDDLLKVAVMLGLAAALLTAYVRFEKAPLWGDVWLTKQVQKLDALHANEGLINAAAPWSWAFAVAAVVLLVVGRRLPSGVPGPVQRPQALAAILAALLLSFGADLLKEIAASPRPSVDFGVHVDHAFGGYGFPSGHVYRDTLVYGVIAVSAHALFSPRVAVAAQAVCVAIILLAGPARIVVGAHWPSDVLGGYLWAAAALALCAWFGRWAVKHP